MGSDGRKDGWIYICMYNQLEQHPEQRLRQLMHELVDTIHRPKQNRLDVMGELHHATRAIPETR